MSNICFDPII